MAKGKLYNNQGVIFDGEFKNGEMWNGIRKLYNGYGKLGFEGEYKNGDINGKVKKYDENGQLIYEGEYLNGKKKDK